MSVDYDCDEDSVECSTALTTDIVEEFGIDELKLDEIEIDPKSAKIETLSSFNHLMEFSNRLLVCQNWEG
jgi:hypothetical protein